MRPAIYFLVSLAVLLPVASRACTCVEPRPPLDELARCTAVFSGQVTNVELFQVPGQGWYRKRVTLTLTECWKGGLGATVVVRTGLSDADCGVQFEVGSDWLVYAGGPLDDLGASLCSRTQPLEKAAYDLEQLGNPVCTVPVTPSSWGTVKRLYGTGARL